MLHPKHPSWRERFRNTGSLEPLCAVIANQKACYSGTILTPSGVTQAALPTGRGTGAVSGADMFNLRRILRNYVGFRASYGEVSWRRAVILVSKELLIAARVHFFCSQTEATEEVERRITLGRLQTVVRLSSVAEPARFSRFPPGNVRESVKWGAA